jgi:hypothetical protein
LLLHAIVHPADIQDRDGGILLLATLFGMYPMWQLARHDYVCWRNMGRLTHH